MNEQIKELLQLPDFRQGEHWHRCDFPAGAEVFCLGDGGMELFFIEHGTVRVLGRVCLEGERQVSPGVSDLGEGEVFGEIQLFDGEPRSATVICVTACRLAIINGEELVAYMERNPERGFEFLRALVTTLVKRLRKSNQKIFTLLAWGLKAHHIDGHL